MKNILFIKSSPRGEASLSTKVAQELVSELRAGDPGATVTVRDLASAPLPHIDPNFVGGSNAESDRAIQELMNADTIVIASAMINFSVSSTLKAWVDHVMRAGVTFRYTENGPEGLVKGKKVYLVQARGGVYSEGPMRTHDFQEPYLKAVLAFMGMTDVESIHVEGVAFGPDAAEKAVGAAVSKAKAFAQAAA